MDMAYSNLDVRFSDVFIENKTQIQSNIALQADYAECAVQRSAYLSNSEKLQDQYDTSSSNSAKYLNMYNTMSNTLNIVQSDYAKTGDSLVQFTDMYNAANSSNISMNVQISQLDTIVAALQKQLQDANQEVFNIGTVQALNENNKRVIDSLSEDVSMYKNAYISSMSQYTANVAKTYDTMCINPRSNHVSAETLVAPVAIPVKKHGWFSTGGDRSGNDLEFFEKISIEQCKVKCLANPLCTQFNHDGTCWLKNGGPGNFGGNGVYYSLIRDADLVIDRV